ncbi:VWA-like domain-containing protein [Tepidiforma flava]|uniref:VWA-like domain-containing protein n=1 Tax=Tepidiforma flava TaxID=3004094 RepID=A0ABY7M2J2_9CHLR|nr:VWA-like domain-containing protein [Tepidiforma flava]WBL34899.1 VWA-like domain-containing protein [Tepidiforma flava]
MRPDLSRLRDAPEFAVMPVVVLIQNGFTTKHTDPLAGWSRTRPYPATRGTAPLTRPWVRLGSVVAIRMSLERTVTCTFRGEFSRWLYVIGPVVVVINRVFERPGEPFDALFGAMRRLRAGVRVSRALERLLAEEVVPGDPDLELVAEYLRARGISAPPQLAADVNRFLERIDPGLQELPPRGDRFERARADLVERLPFFAYLAYHIRHTADPEVPTAAIDIRGRLRTNPAWFEALTRAEAAGAVYHEMAHLLRRHFDRAERAGAAGDLWNIAADLEINDDIPAEFALPPGAIAPDVFGLPRGRTAEEYYRRLSARAGKNLDIARGAGWRPCGSGCGAPRDDAGTPETGGDPGLSRLDIEHIAAQAAADALDHSAEYRMPYYWRRRDMPPGSIPRGWIRHFERLRASRRDWRQELARAVRGALDRLPGMADYTYGRASRRAAAVAPVILPGLCSPAPEVSIVIDTSGSMGEDLLGQALAETRAIVRANGGRGANVHLVDAALHGTIRTRTGTNITPRGGGGTDMRVGIEAALAANPRPNVIIVLTDGFTPWPEKPTPVPLIVGVVGEGHVHPYQANGVPDWARAVPIPLDPRERAARPGPVLTPPYRRPLPGWAEPPFPRPTGMAQGGEVICR